MSTGPQIVPSAARPSQPEPRNWLPLIVAAVVVVLVAAAVVALLGRGKSASGVTPINAAADPYAASLPITALQMSESSNLAGGKVTYLDGHIANKGARTVTAITVQVLFHSYTHEVAQNETQPIQLIRTRDPYVDLEPVSAAPLAPNAEADFRLIFDTVSPDWDGAYPEVRVLRVGLK